MENGNIDKNVLNSNSTSSGVITLSKDNPTFVRGWYGICDEDNICQSFDLRTLPNGTLFKAIQVQSGGKSRISFSPTLPVGIPQAFSNLDCGYYYELTFNKFDGMVSIPGFTAVNTGQPSDNRLDECDAIGVLSNSNEIQQDATESTYVAGWYGKCDETECEPFDLRTLSSDVVFKVIQVTEDGFSRESFSPSLPSAIPQAFSKLECGFIYEFTLKPGTQKLNIPHFVPVYGKLEDMGRISLGGCKLNEPTPTPHPLPIIQFTDATDTSVSVEWTLLGMNQERVKLEISDINNNSVALNQVDYDGEVAEHTFGNLSPSSEYNVRIASVNGGEQGDWVELQTRTTIPGSFGTLSKSLNSNNKPVLTWSVSSMISWNYVSIYKQISGTFSLISKVSISNDDPTNFAFTDESVTEDGTYQYKIQFNNGFDGTFSEIHEFTIDTTPPNVPSPQTTTPTNNNKPEWNWTAIADSVKYHITLNSQSATTTDTKYESSEALSDGQHIIEIIAEDSSGNLSDVGTHNVLIDTTPPDVPVVSTSSNLTNNPRPTWNWGLTADTALFGVIFDDMDEFTTTSSTYTPPNPLTDKSYTIKVRAKDAIGNWSVYGQSTVVVDITSAGIPEPSANTPTKNTSVTWTWSAVSEASTYRLKLNGERKGDNNATSYTATNLTEGSHTFEVASIDNAGNVSEYGKHIVEVDLTAPPISKPSTNTPTNNPKPTWTWPSVATAVEYFVNLYVNNAGSPQTISVGMSTSFTPSENLPTGNHRVEVWSRDSVGNESIKQSHIVEVDLELPPVPQPTTTTPSRNTQPTWTWPGIPNISSYIVTLNNNNSVEVFTNSYQPPIALSEGSHTIKVKAKSQVGNLSNTEGVHTVIIDTTPPNVPVITTDKTLTNNVRPVFSWARTDDAFEYGVVLDAGSEVKQTSNSFTPPTNLSDGDHTLKVRVRDNVMSGNWSVYGSITIKVDTTPPTNPSISGPSLSRDRTPTFTWNSTGSPIEYGVKFDGGSESIQTTTSYAIQNNLNDGNYTLQVRAKDNANNWSDFSSHTIKIYCIPDSHEIFNINGQDMSLQTINGAISLQGFPTENVIGLKSEEFSAGTSGIVVAYLEGNFLGMMTLTSIVPPNAPTKLYLQAGHTCYVADLGEAQSADTHYEINFVKILN